MLPLSPFLPAPAPAGRHRGGTAAGRPRNGGGISLRSCLWCCRPAYQTLASQVRISRPGRPTARGSLSRPLPASGGGRRAAGPGSEQRRRGARGAQPGPARVSPAGGGGAAPGLAFLRSPEPAGRRHPPAPPPSLPEQSNS